MMLTITENTGEVFWWGRLLEDDPFLHVCDRAETHSGLPSRPQSAICVVVQACRGQCLHLYSLGSVHGNDGDVSRFGRAEVVDARLRDGRSLHLRVMDAILVPLKRTRNTATPSQRQPAPVLTAAH